MFSRDIWSCSSNLLRFGLKLFLLDLSFCRGSPTAETLPEVVCLDYCLSQLISGWCSGLVWFPWPGRPGHDAGVVHRELHHVCGLDQSRFVGCFKPTIQILAAPFARLPVPQTSPNDDC